MRTRLLLFVAPLVLAASTVSAQSRDPYFATFTAAYDLIYHEFGETSALGGHFDIASTIKRDIPFLSLAGEVGINHFDGANVTSFLGGPRLRLPLRHVELFRLRRLEREPRFREGWLRWRKLIRSRRAAGPASPSPAPPSPSLASAQ